MSNNLRIAVVASQAAPLLLQQLQALPSHPVVHVFADLFDEAAAIHAFAPRLLFIEHGPRFEERLGAVKILTTLLPELSVIVICDEAVLSAVNRASADRELLVLTQQHSIAELHQVVANALTGAPGTDAESYLQFVQGICDEINNPLLFASGHLQLLESKLDRDSQAGALAQVAAIRKGLSRIDETMRKVSNMSRATKGDRMHEAFAMGSLLAQTEEQLRASDLRLAIDCSDEIRIVPMHGDLTLLSGALFSLAQVALELQGEGTDRPTLEVRQHRDILEVRMLVENARLQAWELPKAFEPYHLNRVLRGTTLGLNLFLVRLVCRAHGGDAIASRQSESSVEFRIGLGSRQDPVDPR